MPLTILLTAHRSLPTDYGVFVFTGVPAGVDFIAGEVFATGDALAAGVDLAAGVAFIASDGPGDGEAFGVGDAPGF